VKSNWFTPALRGIRLASPLSDLGHEVPTSLLRSLVTSTSERPRPLSASLRVADGLAGVARFAGGALADDTLRR
jgi:hypothetical protein